MTTMPSSSWMHYVYMLRCADGSLYIGETGDPANRLIAHNEGRCIHTSKRRPVEIVYSERVDNRAVGLRRERQLKGWTRVKKEALINADWEKLRRS